MKLSVQCTNPSCNFWAKVEYSLDAGRLPDCAFCGSPLQVRSISDQSIQAETRNNASAESLALAEAISNRPSPLPQVPGYTVLAEIGRGGMGVVYRARNERTGQIVALKMILFADLAGSNRLSRFLREVRAMTTLDHPQIVRVVEVGEWSPGTGGQPLPFLSLEYCQGGSLAEFLDRCPNKRVDPITAARTVAQIAHALDHAHRLRIVHRDLKPENVLLREVVSEAEQLPPNVRVADFGLAKCLADSVDLTGSNGVLGTPAYMAPEQASGQSREVGPEADIYAMGVILYRLLTGTLPFQQTNIALLLAAIVAQPPTPPRAVVPQVPRALQRICLRCLEKNPTNRFASAGQLASELQAYVEAESQRQPSAATQPINWWKWAAITLAVVLVVLVTGLMIWLAQADGRRRAEMLEPELDYTDSIAPHEPVPQSPPAVTSPDPEELRRREMALTVQLLRAQALSNSDRQGSLTLLDDPRVFSKTQRDISWVVCRHLVSGLEWKQWKVHNSRINQLLFLDEAGQRLACSSTDSTLRLWDTQQAKQLGQVDLQPCVVNSMVKVADGLLAAGLDDGSIRLVDPVKVCEVAKWNAHQGQVHALAASADGCSLASLGSDQQIQVWDVPKRQQTSQLRLGWRADTLVVHPQMLFAVVPGQEGKLMLCQLKPPHELRAISVGMRSIRRLAIDQEGKRLAVADLNSVIEVYDTQSSRLVSRMRGHQDLVSSLHFIDNNRTLLSVSLNSTVRFWHILTGEERVRLPTQMYGQALAVTPQLTLAIGDVSGTIKLCRFDQLPDGMRKIQP